jgi:hypothetical protein
MSDDTLLSLQRQINAIKLRNAKVGADKAWETSLARVLIISTITYVVAALFLYIVGNERFWLHALVPTIGFYLSSRTLPAIKRRWLEAHYAAPSNGDRQLNLEHHAKQEISVDA